ncbi:hypothetical protein chiPu_0014979 [Chiloscyllium punctatum]|uniref:Secreted protein n=1 Tax=Chiloscyllium punctatum TaxID=137246 RepID=A0A401T1H2_CHIPU|nr:hypothetical protein [Chiloscyllium punctatum]
MPSRQLAVLLISAHASHALNVGRKCGSEGSLEMVPISPFHGHLHTLSKIWAGCEPQVGCRPVTQQWVRDIGQHTATHSDLNHRVPSISYSGGRPVQPVRTASRDTMASNSIFESFPSYQQCFMRVVNYLQFNKCSDEDREVPQKTETRLS